MLIFRGQSPNSPLLIPCTNEYISRVRKSYLVAVHVQVSEKWLQILSEKLSVRIKK